MWLGSIIFNILFLFPLVSGKCAWDACTEWSNDPNIVNLHVVPHSHDDMGWLKTADDYFTGMNGDRSVHVSVYHTYTNVVAELKMDPKKKFAVCEVGFFTRWLESSDTDLLNDFVSLVNNGQIELVCGGWVQPDEAGTHYVDLVDMYTLGLRKLNSSVGGECAKVRTGWQIDPFGHSREHSNFLAMMGYESVYFARQHYREYDLRVKNKNLEFQWYTSDENPTRKLLGGSLYGTDYGSPTLFNWDFRVSAVPPIIDNPKLENYNAEYFRIVLENEISKRVAVYPHNHVLLLMGGDFHYSHANLLFTNIDKLIKIANNMTTRKVNAFYSTPSCYTEAIKEAIPHWTNKTADFFPYARKNNSYWSGYYTSKPAMKGLVRQSSNLINSVRQLGVFALDQELNEYSVKEHKLERAIGLSQHHDAITGTSKEAVTQDYERRLLSGWDSAESAFNDYLKNLNQRFISTNNQFPVRTFCRNLNESECSFTNKNQDNFTITIYNGYSRNVEQLIRIPLYENTIGVLDSNGNEPNQAWMGYDSVYFGREHHKEHDLRIKNKTLEFQWYTSNENPDRKLIGGAFYGIHYGSPIPFHWDYVEMSSPPIIDNPKLEGYNVDYYTSMLELEISLRLSAEPHNHIQMLIGGDFQYTNANLIYTNLDKLIKLANNMTTRKVNAFYSTPSCYTKAIKGAITSWTSKTADFFPYADKNNSYWTGYYTSKPAMKGLVRQSSNLINSVRQLGVFALNQSLCEYSVKEHKLERAIGLSQHHDAITGTSKEAVTQDYERRLLSGWDSAESAFNDYLKNLNQRFISTNNQFPVRTFCRNLNESECSFTNKNQDNFTITIYNGYSRNVEQLIRIPLYENTIGVLDSNGNEPNQAWIVSTFDNKQINNIHRSPNELVLLANLPANGFTTYFVENLANSKTSKIPIHPEAKLSAKANSISNGLITLNFDGNGFLNSITDSQGTHPFQQQFWAYNGHIPVPTGTQTSGAYVFRPQGDPTLIAKYGRADVTFTYLEARQVFDSYVAQTIRLFPNDNKIEFEWTIGPLPIVKVDKLDTSLEVITRYSTNIASNKTFYTDSNGRQMMKRIRNYAPDFDYIMDEPVAGNYYPVTSSAILEDSNMGMTVITDRAQACGSIVNGQIEFLIHRRDLYDDGYGVREPLNEPGKDGKGLVVRGKHWVVIGPQVRKVRPQLQLQMFHSPIISFSTFQDLQMFSELYLIEYSGIKELPENVHVLTLKQLDGNSILLRLEHIYGMNEDPDLSKPVVVDLNSLFSDLKVGSVMETNLAASQMMGAITDTKVTLNPLDIRTFILTVTQ